MTARRRLATILSIAGHPFVLVPLTISLAVKPAMIAVAIALLTVGAMLFVIARQVAAGRWSDYDVSVVEQRHGFYPMALAVIAVSVVVNWWLGMPAGLVRGLLIAFAMLAVGALLTRWTKVSLHVMIGAFCVAAALTVDSRIAAAMALFVATVGWSRVVLRRHTIAQVVLGAVIGAIGGAVLLFLNASRVP